MNYFTTEKYHRVAKYTRQVKKVGKGAHEPKAQTAGAYPGFITSRGIRKLSLGPTLKKTRQTNRGSTKKSRTLR